METLSLEAPETSTLPPIPAKAMATINAWLGFKAAADEYLQKFTALHAAEREALGGGEDTRDYYMVTYEYEARIDVSKIAARALGCLVRTAESEFAPAGARLEISPPRKSELMEASAEAFDPVVVWNYLAKTYGGENGANAAYESTAKALGSDLSIKVGLEPRAVGGRAVFEHRVYPDKIFGHVLSYDDTSSLNRILDGFVAVGKWSGVWAYPYPEAMAIQWMRNDIQLADRGKEIPERRAIGDSILIVPFKYKWEFRIAPAFAEQMQLFLTAFNGFERSHY